MTRYAPIPPIPLDPRNEREIVDLAALKVFEASNGLLSDFSESSPLRAVLEGQAFAYGEFLSYFNQIPLAILTEWIGPFLGAQRRVGSSAFVEVELGFSTPTQVEATIPAGYIVSARAENNNGVAKEYRLLEPLVVPKGTTVITGMFQCTTRGVQGNCPVGAITEFQSLPGLASVTNREVGYGGTNIETLQETQERFLSLIRRRVPVSDSDWKGVFQDLFGTEVQLFLKHDKGGRRVTFYLLLPGYIVPEEPELNLAQAVVENLVPAGYTARVEPMPVQRVDTEIITTYSNLPQTKVQVADSVRNALVEALASNALPADTNLTSSDVEGYVSANLGIGKPYLNPDILFFQAYMTPEGIEPTQSRSQVLPYLSGSNLEENDLVFDPVNDQYYAVVQAFNPTDASKRWYSDQELLRLEVVQPYEAGRSYETGRVLADGDNLRVVLNPFVASGDAFADFNSSFLSEEKTFVPWEVGRLYSNGTSTFNPELIEYEVGDLEVDPYLPTTGPLSLVWLVAEGFVRQEDTTQLGNTQSLGLVASSPATYTTLAQGNVYNTGDYIITPEVPGLQEEYDPGFYYVSPEEGVVQRAFLVTEGFTQTEEVINQFDLLSILQSEENVQPVQILQTDGSLYQKVSYRYRARIRSGEKLYVNGVTYLAIREFTPFTQNVSTLVSRGYLRELPGVSTLEAKPLFELNTGDEVTLRFRGRNIYFSVLNPFTATFNPEVYYRNLLEIPIPTNPLGFTDPTRKVEDVIQVGGAYYKVIRPFTPEDQTVRQLESEGYLQRIVVSVDSQEQIQVAEQYVALPGESLIRVREKNGGDSLFFYSEEEEQAPLYRGGCLF